MLAVIIACADCNKRDVFTLVSVFTLDIVQRLSEHRSRDMFHHPCVASDVATLDLVTRTVYVQRAFVWASASGVRQVIFSG